MEEPKDKALDEVFDSALALHHEITEGTEDTASKALQDKVKKAILMLEDATRLVSLLDIFSRNEHHKELPGEHLKYFLLPVLLGDLTTRLVEGERSEAVENAQVYYVDFLQRCTDYSIVELASVPTVTYVKEEGEEEKENVISGKPDLAKMNAERSGKMARFKETKQLKEDLRLLQESLTKGRDEEVVRQFHIKLIKKFVNSSLDEMASLKMEVEMLQHMAKMRAGKVMVEANPEPARKLKPIVITADKMQKEVYGLGYPSLPVLSVDEFYEQRVAEGWWKPPPATTSALQDRAADPELERRMKEAEEREKDEKEERGCEETRAKAMAWDEWTDEHRRGEGNRKNMG